MTSSRAASTCPSGAPQPSLNSDQGPPELGGTGGPGIKMGSILDKPQISASCRLNIPGKIPGQDLNLMACTLPEAMEELDKPAEDINLG